MKRKPLKVIMRVKDYSKSVKISIWKMVNQLMDNSWYQQIDFYLGEKLVIVQKELVLNTLKQIYAN